MSEDIARWQQWLGPSIGPIGTYAVIRWKPKGHTALGLGLIAIEGQGIQADFSFIWWVISAGFVWR